VVTSSSLSTDFCQSPSPLEALPGSRSPPVLVVVEARPEAVAVVHRVEEVASATVADAEDRVDSVAAVEEVAFQEVEGAVASHEAALLAAAVALADVDVEATERMPVILLSYLLRCFEADCFPRRCNRSATTTTTN